MLIVVLLVLAPLPLTVRRPPAVVDSARHDTRLRSLRDVDRPIVDDKVGAGVG